MPAPRSSRAPGRPPPRPTANRVLDASERLAQTRGFNGFSYADVAARVGVTTASLHYHFPGKAALGLALVARYAERFARALGAIRAGSPRAAERLGRYAAIYGAVLGEGRICLCGMLAAEYETLPPALRAAVRSFFDANETWLAQVLEEGRARGELAFAGEPRDAAFLWTSALEGAMLLARPYGDAARVASVARRLLDAWAPTTRARRARVSAGRRARAPDPDGRRRPSARAP